MEIDHGKNHYSCEEFGYLARNCKNWRIVEQGRKLEYKSNLNNNLNGKESLVVLD